MHPAIEAIRLEEFQIAEQSALRDDTPNDVLERLLFEDHLGRDRAALMRRYDENRCVAIAIQLGDEKTRTELALCERLVMRMKSLS